MSVLPRALTALILCFAACASPGPRPTPVAPEASRALADARRMLREGAAADDPALGLAIARARSAAPDWPTPRRLEDDLALAELLGPPRLDARRAQLTDRPGDATLYYLVGRLEGEDGARRFEAAARVDPDSAWAQHGLAWSARRRGDAREAVRRERRAIALARDPWDGAFFRVSLARHLVARDERDEAVDEMRDPRARTGLASGDRAWFESETALVEIATGVPEIVRVGVRRGLEVLRRADLAPEQLERLVSALSNAVSGLDPSGRALELALAARPGVARERLRARVLVAADGGPLALALAKRHARRTDAELTRAARLRAGRFREAYEEWLAALPRQVLASDGLPRDERLRSVVRWARRIEDDAPTAGTLVGLGAALVRAGRFDEAEAIARELADLDVDAALAVHDRAQAGALLVERLARRLTTPEGGVPPHDDPLTDGSSRTVTGEIRDGAWHFEGSALDMDQFRDGRSRVRLLDRLGRFLYELAPAIVEAHEWLGGETDLARVRETIVASPRLDYGVVGELLHPGPRFSAEDAAAGVGVEGDPVPGLAAELASIGRFATIGTLVGHGLDGVVLQRLAIEERAGEHLGVPFRGTVAWCDGVDTAGRNGRRGARVSGAALHEGYWVDVASVRRDHDRWRSLAEDLDREGGPARARRALSTTGLALRELPEIDSADALERRSRARRAIEPALDQSRRVRLAVLVDRRARGTGDVTLGELVECVAAHEEAHLCDRTRFLPLGENLGAALRFVLASGVTPDGVQARLEYRAQLTALCVVHDPRVPLAEVVRSAEVLDDGPLPHARAYRALLADLLETLDRELARTPERWPALDPNRTLLHQLHRVGPEELRGLARRLADREGLVRN